MAGEQRQRDSSEWGDDVPGRCREWSGEGEDLSGKRRRQMSQVAFSLVAGVAGAAVAVGVVVVPVGKVAGQECQQRLEDGRVAQTLRVVGLGSSVAPWALIRRRRQRRIAARGIWQPMRAAGGRAGGSVIGRFVETVGLSAVMALGTSWYGSHRSLGASWRVGWGLRCAAAAAGRWCLGAVAVVVVVVVAVTEAGAATVAAAGWWGAVAAAGRVGGDSDAGGSSAGRCLLAAAAVAGQR